MSCTLKVANGTERYGSTLEIEGGVVKLFAVEGKNRVLTFGYCLRPGETLIRNSTSGDKTHYEINI